MYYKEDDGSVPVVDFMKALPRRERAKLLGRVERLEQMGFELPRPEADYLRDGIYELRMRQGHINYRILYFFHKSSDTAAVLAAGMTKHDVVPPAEIERAIERKSKYGKDPNKHGFSPTIGLQ